MATQQHTYVDGNILPASWLNDEWTQLYTDITDANIASAAAIARSKLATTGADTADTFTANGLTGAVAASRYAGATSSGHPITGTFAVGDFVLDHVGALWVCTTAGTPGTWQPLVVAIGATTTQKVQAAQIAITTSASAANYSSTWTYPTAFTSGPTVTATVTGITNPNIVGIVTTGAVSATGAVAYIDQTDASARTVDVDLIAIGN